MNYMTGSVEAPSRASSQQPQYVVCLLTAAKRCARTDPEVYVKAGSSCKIGPKKQRRRKCGPAGVDRANVAGMLWPAISASHTIRILHSDSENVVFHLVFKP